MSLWTRIERTLSDFAGELLPDEFRIRVSAARELLQEGRLDEASTLLERLVEERPNHAIALSLLGAAKLELGDPESAVGLFGRAVSERPDDANALIGLGQANLSLGQWRPAIDAFRSAVSEARGDRGLLAEAYRGLGIGYRRVGDVEKAIRELRKAVAENESDPIARAALGEALLADERISSTEARKHLELATDSGGGTALAYLALGRIALEEEDAESAQAAFVEAMERAREEIGLSAKEAVIQAFLGLGDAAMMGGDTDLAHKHYLQALAGNPRDANVHARIGDVHRDTGSHDAALASYDRSLALSQDMRVLRRALDTALEGGDVNTAVRLANEILAENPGDTRAMVARGVALAENGQTDAARATFLAALEQGVDAEAHLALSRLELDTDTSRAAGSRASAAALAALRVFPESTRAREMLSEARARELGDFARERKGGERNPEVEQAGKQADGQIGELAGDASEMYRLAEQFGRIAVTRPELATLSAEAMQAVADFDRPLLVTVMGEFSSGKSSFVNAFIGDEVAPTGITPTTATINVVKYGRERSGRILYRDGSIETLDWSELFPALNDLPTERVRAIEMVEILLPLTQLERVNIVDTPGLNSILPEHEEVARGFIARADAVVWLFTASQAGKASERKALSSIQREGKRVLGVLNKKDQLSARDVDELVAYVEVELGDRVELVVPFSARQALAHKQASAASVGSRNGDDGNWARLAVALEERFFAQARQLKRDACSHRLASLLQRACSIVHTQRQVANDAAAALRARSVELSLACADFIDLVVLEERKRLVAAVEELYRCAAVEVLELVRPRELPFGSHRATLADKDYLLSMLASGYEAALERSRRDVVAGLNERCHPVIVDVSRFVGVVGEQSVSDVTRTADDAVRLVEAQVYERTRAFLRGYLSGGFVGNFFRHDVPKLELDEEKVYQALFRDSPDLDAEIALPLAKAGTTALQTLSRRLEHWADVADVVAYDVETGLLRSLDGIEERRRSLTDPSK